MEEIVKQIEKLTVLELAELVKALEQKFGVSAAAPMMAPMAVPLAPPPIMRPRRAPAAAPPPAPSRPPLAVLLMPVLRAPVPLLVERSGWEVPAGCEVAQELNNSTKAISTEKRDLEVFMVKIG